MEKHLLWPRFPTCLCIYLQIEALQLPRFLCIHATSISVITILRICEGTLAQLHPQKCKHKNILFFFSQGFKQWNLHEREKGFKICSSLKYAESLKVPMVLNTVQMTKHKQSNLHGLEIYTVSLGEWHNQMQRDLFTYVSCGWMSR